MNKGLILGIIIVVVLGAIVGGSYISYHNTWTEKKNLYEAQVEKDKVIYDEVLKVISQQAQVTEKFSENFRNNYVAIMEGRYGEDGRKGGGLLNLLQEDNPQFTDEMYVKLMNSIESLRAKFTRNQERLLSIHQELKNLKEKFPSSIFLGGKELPELKTVTSTRVNDAFDKGVDDDDSVF